MSPISSVGTPRPWRLITRFSGRVTTTGPSDRYTPHWSPVLMFPPAVQLPISRFRQSSCSAVIGSPLLSAGGEHHDLSAHYRNQSAKTGNDGTRHPDRTKINYLGGWSSCCGFLQSGSRANLMEGCHSFLLTISRREAGLKNRLVELVCTSIPNHVGDDQ